jgi:hypothetical protein
MIWAAQCLKWPASANAELGPPLPDIASVRITSITKALESEALQNLGGGVEFLKCQRTDHYPGLVVPGNGNQFHGCTGRVTEAFEFLEREVGDLHPVLERWPDKCAAADSSAVDNGYSGSHGS